MKTIRVKDRIITVEVTISAEPAFSMAEARKLRSVLKKFGAVLEERVAQEALVKLGCIRARGPLSMRTHRKKESGS
ncbi:MAG TPA: hypothetical protein VG273_16340 [Bryobacteraceae bacterium]|nr:hypothetical protein [Bryobacteraceae bacterium]